MKKNKYFFLAIAFFLSQFSAFAQTFEIKNGNWTYEIYDMTTSMYVHNETVPYSATRTLNYTPQLYHTYLISARNADNDVYVTTKVIVNN